MISGRRDVIPLFILAFLLFLGQRSSEAAEKITIGPVEEVILLPWGIKLLARIDTGAATTSLGAKNLEIKGNIAEFDVREEYGGTHLKLPIVEWRGFVNAGGHELRPVVEMEICIASKRLRTQVNLNDRSGVAFPMLIGRRVLQGKFIVDVSRPGEPAGQASS